MSRNYASSIEVPSYSDLRLYSICPRLWYEQNVTKEYVQPEEDYFIYGQLLDTILTEPEMLDQRFVRVQRRSKEGAGMELVGKVKTLEAEITELELSLVEKPNKTKEKGLAARKAQLADLSKEMKAVRSAGDRTQVVNSIWENAHETAECIKRNPLWEEIEKAKEEERLLSQLAIESGNLNFKGTMDLVILPRSVTSAITLWKTGNVGKEALRGLEGYDEQFCGIIDVKSTFQMAKLDPKCYATQLSGYQALMEDLLGYQLPCFALVGDKDPDRKMAQDFAYDQKVLDRAFAELWKVKEQFEHSIYTMGKEKTEFSFPAAKVLDGKDQTCFRCSVCRERPYSTDKPYLVTV